MNKLRYHITISLIAISNLVLAQGLPDDESKMSFYLDPDVKKMIDKTYFSGVLGFVRRLICSVFSVRWSIKLVDSNNDESKKIIDIALKTLGDRFPIMKSMKTNQEDEFGGLYNFNMNTFYSESFWKRQGQENLGSVMKLEKKIFIYNAKNLCQIKGWDFNKVVSYKKPDEPDATEIATKIVEEVD